MITLRSLKGWRPHLSGWVSAGVLAGWWLRKQDQFQIRGGSSNPLMRILRIFSAARQQALNVFGPCFPIGFDTSTQKSFANLRNAPPLFQSNLFKLCFEFLRNPDRKC